ncbi:hypothetical protein PT974_00394 [Cladobotryum mycophilum]|uniref:Uncharacterized protein n=1 Tax=Cladobotryum mycophilum TaxID=491253 RepID=A0ABR0T0R0_9HYPO
MDPSSKSFKDLRNSQGLVPARSPPELGKPLSTLDVPSKERHKRVHRVSRTPGVQIHTETVPGDSGVGEQPYNDAGAKGAANRINNSLKKLQEGQVAGIIEKHKIGTVIVGAIENFIQTEGVGCPVDYAIAIVHNATTGQTAAACSRGVTLKPEYIGWAQKYGFVNGNQDHGEKTVGNCLAAEFPDLDSRNWHKVLAGVSRYTLLREALENLPHSWQPKPHF